MGVSDINRLLGKGIEEIFEAYEAVSENFIKSNELGISSRVLNYYKTHELLLPETKIGKHEHPVFSFTDYAWFQMIQELRRYDIGISVLQNIKELFMTPLPIGEFMQELKENATQTEKLIDKLPENLGDEFNEFLHGDTDWNEVEKMVSLNLLSLVLAEAITQRKQMSLLIGIDGDLCPFALEDLDALNENGKIQDFFKKTFISLSISSIIKKFIINFDIDLSAYKLSLLTKREAEVIKILHEEKVEALTIHLDKGITPGKNKTIELIEVMESYNKLDKEARLLDIILQNGYQTIEMKTQAGKIVHCKNIRKIKPQ